MLSACLSGQFQTKTNGLVCETQILAASCREAPPTKGQKQTTRTAPCRIPVTKPASRVTPHVLSKRSHNTNPHLYPEGNSNKITTRGNNMPSCSAVYQQPMDDEHSPTWSIGATMFASRDLPRQPPPSRANRQKLPHGWLHSPWEARSKYHVQGSPSWSMVISGISQVIYLTPVRMSSVL